MRGKGRDSTALGRASAQSPREAGETGKSCQGFENEGEKEDRGRKKQKSRRDAGATKRKRPEQSRGALFYETYSIKLEM